MTGTTTVAVHVHLVSRSFDLGEVTLKNHQTGLVVTIPTAEWESLGSPNTMRVGLTVS